MKAAAKFDFNKVPANQKFNTRLMVTIESDEKAQGKKQPLNLALVLDHSGSMNGAKLAYVKEATKILTRQLGKDDIFSLTMFESLVTPLIAPLKMADGRGIDSTIDKIRSAGTTCLSGGYQQGCDFAKENKTNDNITRVMLLTDGLANEGITNVDQLADLAKKAYDQGITTTTIGVGNDYNEFLLGKMAENGGGGTYFIENPDDAPDVFKEELGYLLNLVATGLEVKFVSTNGDINYEQLNTYRVSKKKEYLLGDIYGSQKKLLILELELPPMDISASVELGHVEISYQDTSGDEIVKKNISLPLIIDVVSEADFASVKADKEVTIESALLMVAQAKSRGIELADQRNFKEAARVLNEYADKLESLNLNDPRLNDEIKELRNRARQFIEYGEEFYTMQEKKRMFYESDKVAKSNLASYDAMLNRRKPMPEPPKKKRQR